ncbi:8004_t:CDS:2, partial [Diversispora eburnea]
EQTTREDLIEALKNASLDFQSVARAEKKKETLKQIQEAEGNNEIITDSTEIKDTAKNHFCNWTRKRNMNENLMEKWKTTYNLRDEIEEK